MTQLLFPAVSAKTPLASLSGCDLVMACPKCGDRIKRVEKLCEAVGLCRELGDILPRLSCDTCRSKPVGMRFVNTWIKRFDREPSSEDLTFLLPQPTELAA
jgi:hypothetical protein